MSEINKHMNTQITGLSEGAVPIYNPASPIYMESADYAREHGEINQFRESMHLNLACRDAIDAAVRDNFDGMWLKKTAPDEVLRTYGPDRVLMVLANTVNEKEWDGRFSRRNKEWAAQVPIPDIGKDRRCYLWLNSHSAVLNGFIDLTKEAVRKLEMEKSSVIAQLKQTPEKYNLPKPNMKGLSKPEHGG